MTNLAQHPQVVALLARARLHTTSGSPVEEFIFERAELNALLAAQHAASTTAARRQVLEECLALYNRCVRPTDTADVADLLPLREWLTTQLREAK